MRHYSSRLLAVCAVWLIGSMTVEACGDKLAAFRRGIRFQRAYSAARQASILIYAGHGESLLRDAEFQAKLKQVGHKLTIIEDLSKLDGELKSTGFQLVLAGVADAPALAAKLQALPSKPLLLPVMQKPSKTDFVAAQRQYSFVLKSPGEPAQYLAAIDDAMKSRAKSIS